MTALAVLWSQEGTNAELMTRIRGLERLAEGAKRRRRPREARRACEVARELRGVLVGRALAFVDSKRS